MLLLELELELDEEDLDEELELDLELELELELEDRLLEEELDEDLELDEEDELDDSYSYSTMIDGLLILAVVPAVPSMKLLYLAPDISVNGEVDFTIVFVVAPVCNVSVSVAKLSYL